MTIRVTSITQESYNKLIAAGYRVVFVQEADLVSPYAKYIYEKTTKPKRTKRVKALHKCVGTRCKICGKKGCEE